MILYLKKVRELLKNFTWVQVRHVPRAGNTRADALAKVATTPQEDLDRLIPVEHLPEPSVNIDGEEVSPVMSEPSWMDPIWDYLVDGTLPIDPKEASNLRTRSTRFTIHRGTLYKRGFSTPILKCVGKEDANYVLREGCMKVFVATISESGPWQQRHQDRDIIGPQYLKTPRSR